MSRKLGVIPDHLRAHNEALVRMSYVRTRACFWQIQVGARAPWSKPGPVSRRQMQLRPTLHPTSEWRRSIYTCTGTDRARPSLHTVGTGCAWAQQGMIRKRPAWSPRLPYRCDAAAAAAATGRLHAILLARRRRRAHTHPSRNSGVTRARARREASLRRPHFAGCAPCVPRRPRLLLLLATAGRGRLLRLTGGAGPRNRRERPGAVQAQRHHLAQQPQRTADGQVGRPNAAASRPPQRNGHGHRPRTAPPSLP